MMEHGVKGFTVVQVILLSLASSCYCAREPQCSQYHFLEQLLDKMIRTEVKFEEMQKQVEDQLKQNKLALSSVEETYDRIRVENSEILADVRKVAQDLKDEQLVPTVVFNARDVADKSVGNGQKYVFTNVVYNHGGGYDATSGTFTAPFDGTYMFTTNLCVDGATNYICYDIMSEGISLSRGVEYGSGGGKPCNAIDAVVVLRAGEKVWIQSTCGTFLAADQYRMNSFAGALLHK